MRSAVQWEDREKTMGRIVLDETVVHGGRVRRRESIRVKRNPNKFSAIVAVDFDAIEDTYTGFVCPFCGSTERASLLQCAHCGVTRF